MKKIKGLVLRRLGNEAMIVAESLELIDFDKLVSLNDSAAYIWESLPDSDFDEATIAGLLTDRYDVDYETAYKDASELVNLWIRAGIIDEQ
ncbi:MAG: PqqD family protein [Bacteroides sp.]|nr:PqqD family protein [Bacteroides sp.]